MEDLREVASRALCTHGLASVIPTVHANVVDDRVCAFCGVTAWVEPPNLSKTRHLSSPNLLTLSKVQVVKEVVLVEVVWNFLDHTVVHQEAINAAPIVDAVILDHGLTGQN